MKLVVCMVHMDMIRLGVKTKGILQVEHTHLSIFRLFNFVLCCTEQQRCGWKYKTRELGEQYRRNLVFRPL